MIKEINRPDVAQATLQGPQGALPFHLFKTEVCFQIANAIFSGATYPNVPFVSGCQNHSRHRSECGRGVSLSGDQLSPGAGVCLRARERRLVRCCRRIWSCCAMSACFPSDFIRATRRCPYFMARRTAWSLPCFPALRTDCEGEPIRLACASQFLSEHGIESVDILKIDTEGCEVPILRSLSKYLPEVKVCTWNITASAIAG